MASHLDLGNGPGNNVVHLPSQRHALILIYSFLLPLTILLPPVYGPSIDGTCWLPKDQKEFDYIFMVPLLFYMFIGVVSLIVSICRVNNLAQARRYKLKVIFRLMFYIIVFLGCWLGLTIHEFYYLTQNPDLDIVQGLRWWASLGIALSGLGNSIIWLTNPTLWSAFKKVRFNSSLPSLALVLISSSFREFFRAFVDASFLLSKIFPSFPVSKMRCYKTPRWI